MYLRELNLEDAVKEYKFFQELPSENGFENPYFNISFELFNNSIPERIDYSNGINLKEGHVPDTYFFLWDNEEIIGLFKVRHYLNDFLKNGSGHIGYAIHPKFRNRGYASKGLKLAIEELVKMNDFKEDEVYLSCNKNNGASLKVMLNNSGYIFREDEKEYYVRIKVGR